MWNKKRPKWLTGSQRKRPTRRNNSEVYKCGLKQRTGEREERKVKEELLEWVGVPKFW